MEWDKEEDEVRHKMESGLFNPYVKELYENSVCLSMGRWLMIEVRDESIMNDIFHLIRVRMETS